MKRIIMLYIFGSVSSILLAAVLNRVLHFFFLSMLISIMISFLACVIYFWLDWRKSEIKSEQGLHINILLAILIPISAFSFLSFIPINVDRSFTVITLSTINNQYNTNLELEELQTKVSTFFRPENKEILRRIEEQVFVGNLELKEGEVILTKRGRFQVFVNDVIAYIFDLNLKYVRGLK